MSKTHSLVKSLCLSKNGHFEDSNSLALNQQKWVLFIPPNWRHALNTWQLFFIKQFVFIRKHQVCVCVCVCVCVWVGVFTHYINRAHRLAGYWLAANFQDLLWLPSQTNNQQMLKGGGRRHSTVGSVSASHPAGPGLNLDVSNFLMVPSWSTVNTAYTVDSVTLIVNQTHPVLASGKPYRKKISKSGEILLKSVKSDRLRGSQAGLNFIINQN